MTGLSGRREYARAGFWQLLAVTVLALGVIRLGQRWAPGGRRAPLAVLAVLTLGVVATALGRMWLYQQAYGFTVLRLLVVVCEVWLGIGFVLVLVAVLRRRRTAGLVVTGAVLLLGLALADPERMVAELERRTPRRDRVDRRGVPLDALGRRRPGARRAARAAALVRARRPHPRRGRGLAQPQRRPRRGRRDPAALLPRRAVVTGPAPERLRGRPRSRRDRRAAVAPAARRTEALRRGDAAVVAAGSVEPQLRRRPDRVRLVLEHHAQRRADGVVVEGVEPEGEQRAAPVDRLRHRRRLAQLQGAQHPDGAHERVDERLGQLRDAGGDDAALQVGVGEVEVQEQAAALERLGQLARGVGGEQRERRRVALMVPSSGTVTWKSDSTSSSRPSTSTSALSISSISSTVGSSRRIAVSSGRGSRNSSENTSSRVASHDSRPWPEVIRSSCLAWFHS
jgi:hypothetical protein